MLFQQALLRTVRGQKVLLLISALVQGTRLLLDWLKLHHVVDLVMLAVSWRPLALPINIVNLVELSHSFFIILHLKQGDIFVLDISAVKFFF